MKNKRNPSPRPRHRHQYMTHARVVKSMRWETRLNIDGVVAEERKAIVPTNGSLLNSIQLKQNPVSAVLRLIQSQFEKDLKNYSHDIVKQHLQQISRQLTEKATALAAKAALEVNEYFDASGNEQQITIQLKYPLSEIIKSGKFEWRDGCGYFHPNKPAKWIDIDFDIKPDNEKGT